MKLKTIAALSLIIFCLGFSGCGKVWFVDFTDTVLADDWLTVGPCSVGAFGLIMDEGFVSSLVAFDGDFNVTVIFDLNVNATADKANFSIWLSDGHSISPDNYITSFGRGLGDPANEEYGVRDYNNLEAEPRFLVNLDAPYPGLNRAGTNKWVLEKKGSHIKITMNDTYNIAEFDIIHYQATKFHMNIYGETGNAGLLHFKSIKVEYSDNIILP